MYLQELSLFPLHERQVGVAPRCSGGQNTSEEEECDYPSQAHTRSKLQHKNKSFTEAQYERDF